MSLVWDNFHRGGSDKLAMLALADWCNDQGGSLHPSIASIAKKINRTEKQSREIIHRLIAEGWIAVVGNENGGNPGASRRYQMDILKLVTPPASVTPNDSVTPNVQRNDPSRQRSFTPPASVSLTTSDPSIEPPLLGDKSLKQIRARSLPSDFAPSAKHYALADELQINLKSELPQFIDYHTAKGSRMANWDSALNTWIRNASKFGRKHQGFTTKQSNRDSYAAQAAMAQANLDMGGQQHEHDITADCTRVA